MPGTTDVLDDFNRADASTLGANWSLFTDFGLGGNDDFSIISNTAALGASGQFTTYDFLYWNVSIFGENCEVYMTLSTATTGAFALLARGKGAGVASTVDGYYLDLQRGDTPDSWRIYRFDDGVATQLGATVSQNVSSGNSMLFECRGSTLKGYLNTGSGWSEIISRTDTTYNDAGWAGFYGDGNDTGWRYDNFGGGTLPSGIVYAPNLHKSNSSAARVELWLTTDTGTRIAQLTTGLGFSGTKVDGALGAFSYNPPKSFDLDLFQPDHMLQFWYQPRGGAMGLWNVYLLRYLDIQASKGKQTVTIAGPDVMELLRRRIVAAYSSSANAAYSSDYADDIMKAIATASISDAADPIPIAGSRVWDNLSISSDVSKGPTTSISGIAFKTLLTDSGSGVLPELQRDSRSKGTEVFFRIDPNVVTGSTINFTFNTKIGQPGQDVTADLTFDENTMDSFRYVEDYRNEANYIYATGQGNTTDRNVHQRYDSDRYNRSIWGRMELEADARDVGTNALVQARGDAALAAGKPRIHFSATLSNIDGAIFGVDWDFGYKVRAKAGNRLFDCIIRATSISINQSGRIAVQSKIDYDGAI